MKIEEVEGIGATFAAKLGAAGVSSTDDLLEQGAKPSGRAALEQATGISHDQILEWVDPVPEPILGIGLLALAAVFIVSALRDRRATERGTCHGHDHGTPSELEAGATH